VTRIVDNNLSCKDSQYTTITAAYNASADGDRIFVCPGTYNESLVINKAVTIKGTNGRIGPKPQRCWKPVDFPGTSSVDAVVTGTFTVSHDHVTLQMLTFDTGGSNAVVVPAGVNDFTLANSAVQNNATGLALNGFSHTVTFSCFRNNVHGILSDSGLDSASIDHTYFANNSTSGIDLLGPAAGGGTVTDVDLEFNFTRDDTHFLRVYDTVNTTLKLTNGDGGTTVGDDVNEIELHDGNSNFDFEGNFYKMGDGDAIYLTSDGGASNTGTLFGNQATLNAGSGIEAVNNGLDNSLIAHSINKKNGGSGIRLDAASTGNTLEINRLNQNGGIDCEDRTVGPANDWSAGNRGDEETYPDMCGPKAVVVP